MNDARISLADWLDNCGGAIGILFTDIVGSTSLLYSLRTADYTRILRAHRVRVTEIVSQQQGRVVEQSGDQIVAAFPSATAAYLAAVELFRDEGHSDLRVRAGVHFGTVRDEGDAIVGRNVHLCARIMQRGINSELWVSDVAKQELEKESPDLGSSLSWLGTDSCSLSGVPERQLLWRAV